MALKKGDKFVLELGEERTETHECNCISRQAAIDVIQQHRENVLGDYEYDESVALFINFIEDYNYCPHCGARMEVTT